MSLKEALNLLYRPVFGRRLAYLSLARFDQQVTTKFHLDDSPDEAYLMLGYEPPEVPSAVAITDFTRAAYDWGIEPRTLLSNFNPMIPSHERRLLPYVTRLEGFDPSRAQVLLINNSSLPYREGAGHVLGVMHQATIAEPLPDRHRIVNSTMIGSVDDEAVEPMSPRVQRAFVETREIAGEVQGSC